MEKNKWFFFFWLIAGSSMAGQAAHYFIGGATHNSSSLRDFLVVIQLVAGIAIAFYGWKKYQILDKSEKAPTDEVRRSVL